MEQAEEEGEKEMIPIEPVEEEKKKWYEREPGQIGLGWLFLRHIESYFELKRMAKEAIEKKKDKPWVSILSDWYCPNGCERFYTHDLGGVYKRRFHCFNCRHDWFTTYNKCQDCGVTYSTKYWRKIALAWSATEECPLPHIKEEKNEPKNKV